MKSSIPLVKIGVPTFNRPEQVKRTLGYLLSQDYKNIEVYVSENGTAEHDVPQGLRVCRMTHSVNIGAEANFNFVYNVAGKSDYFMWMADGDIFEDNYISACVEFLEHNSDYIMCAGQTFMTKNGETLFMETPMNIGNRMVYDRLFNYLFKVRKNGVFYGVFRNKTRLFNPIGNHVASDWVHVAKLAMAGKIKVLEHTRMYKDDNGSASSRKKMVQRWNVSRFQELFFETYTSWHIAKRLPLTLPIFLFLNLKFLFNSTKKFLRKHIVF